MFNLKQHDPGHIFTCISYCGKVDRVLHKYDPDRVHDEKTLKCNAGFGGELEPDSRDIKIARGTLEWLEEFHSNPNMFSLSNTGVKSMHRKLFKYSDRDEGARGCYRTDLENIMKALFEHTKSELMSEERHPLFTISIFRVSFINAIPFITGNLLCANLIAYALLFTHEYGIVSQLPLIASLNNADSRAAKDVLSLLPKTLFELLSAGSVRPCSKPERRTSNPNTYLNPRRKQLLSHIKKNAPQKISDIMNEFPDESRNTIKKDLLYLRENGMISARGEGRGMVYTVTNDL